MAGDVAVTVQIEGEEPLIDFPDVGVTLGVPITQVGDDLYRLDGVPVFVECASFGDVIEAIPSDDGRLRFVRVAEPGGWRTFEYLLPAAKIEGESGQCLLRELDARGGHWERVFGGVLFACIPPGLDLDLTLWIETV